MVTHFFNDDALIGTFFHLAGYPNAAQALETLKRVASLVKPIMRRHSFRIAKLAEFYPEMEPNLLGLNTSFPGSNNLPIIQLRLRKSHDSRIFLPYESVVETMVHELTHCVHGPHDERFWAIFKSLRAELDTLRYTGYTGEGFLGNGQALGDVPRGINNLEAKRKAREAAEQRRKRDQGRGRILGTGSIGPIRWTIETGPGSVSTLKPRDGRGPGRQGAVSAPPMDRSPYATPQQTAAGAALKRQWDKIKGKDKAPISIAETPSPRDGQATGACSGVRHSTAEQVEREIAQMHGFESVNDMESANERAIMAAAIELLEEADREEERLDAKERSHHPPSKSTTSTRAIDRAPPHDISRTQSAPVVPQHTKPTPTPSPAPSNASAGWPCPICTFRNEEKHLQCSLCRVERNTRTNDDSETRAQITAYKDFERQKPQPPRPSAPTTLRAQGGVRDKGKGVDRSLHGGGTPSVTSAPFNKDFTINGQPTWKCHSCGWFVAQEWWSCSNCRAVKQNS
ncbi:hypothetical protein Dda_4992 [Drechslerella dactyloides]|uniref:WLM-domain-containing protein n=1 Tax=Drechslerella dactyloides TaxID=74499 RepID=A0AAD6IXX1_DREDA|nr:hypothetical protein Dda_4992 [Drechslerella dactyloides]